MLSEHFQVEGLLQGKMSKEQFLDKSKELMGDQASLMGEALFRVFDEDGRLTIFIKHKQQM